MNTLNPQETSGSASPIPTADGERAVSPALPLYRVLRDGEHQIDPARRYADGMVYTRYPEAHVAGRLLGRKGSDVRTNGRYRFEIVRAEPAHVGHGNGPQVGFDHEQGARFRDGQGREFRVSGRLFVSTGGHRYRMEGDPMGLPQSREVSQLRLRHLLETGEWTRVSETVSSNPFAEARPEETLPKVYLVAVVKTMPDGRGYCVGYLRNDQETGRLETVPYGLADAFSKVTASKVAERFNGLQGARK